MEKAIRYYVIDSIPLSGIPVVHHWTKYLLHLLQVRLLDLKGIFIGNLVLDQTCQTFLEQVIGDVHNADNLNHPLKRCLFKQRFTRAVIGDVQNLDNMTYPLKRCPSSKD